jgi:hypothetical protein
MDARRGKFGALLVRVKKKAGWTAGAIQPATYKLSRLQL